MTSIPSIHDVRQSISQLLAGDAPGPHPPGFGFGHGPGREPGMADDPSFRHSGPEWDGPDLRNDLPQGSPPFSRGEVDGNPLPHAGLPAQLSDSLATLLRQNPSMPLLQQLQHLPPEALRQMEQLLVRQPEALSALLAQAQARADHRETASLLATEVRRDLPPQLVAAEARRAELAEARASAAFAQMQMAAGERAMAALAGRPEPGALPGTGAAGHSGQAAGTPGVTQDSLLQPPQMRAADMPSPAARADAAAVRAGEPAGSPGGLGLGIAAGVTLAAVGNPAGTTFATAPNSSLRARKAEDEEGDRKRVDEETAQGDEHEHARDDGHRENGDDRRDPAEAPGRKRRAATTPAASGEAFSVAAIGLMLPAYDDDADTPPPGHVGEAPSRDQPLDRNARRTRRLRWLYWSLIAVAYACLGLALASVAADWFLNRAGLPVPNSVAWRHGFTVVGLSSALWAWLVARRMP